MSRFGASHGYFIWQKTSARVLSCSMRLIIDSQWLFRNLDACLIERERVPWQVDIVDVRPQRGRAVGSRCRIGLDHAAEDLAGLGE